VTDQLIEVLRNEQEIDMVRHECAEALGSIATDRINEELAKYLDKSQPEVLRESCVVALDFSDYNSSGQFQYADSLGKV
jgi:deoxyhypusine monooxygenase